MRGGGNIINYLSGSSDSEFDLTVSQAIKSKCDDVKREMYYRFFIVLLVIGLILTIVWRGADSSAEVLNQLSLASSITSIFLAFIAIIYAFYQSQIATEQSSQMQNYLRKIGEQVDQLSGISSEIAEFKTIFDHRMDAVKVFQEEVTLGNEKMNKSISSISDLLTEIKPGNEEMIEKLKEEFKQLKKVNDQQNTKVSENFGNLVSSSILGSITVPNSNHKKFTNRNIVTKNFSITLCTDDNQWNNELSNEVWLIVKDELIEKLRTKVKLNCRIENYSKDLVTFNITVTMSEAIMNQINIESLVQEILKEKFKYIVR